MTKKPASSSQSADHYPSLRGALWLYLAALLLTAVIISFAANIELVLLNLLAALIACGGLTMVALFVTDVRPGVIFGQRPAIRSLILGVLVGFAVWVPTSWLQVAVYGYVTAVVGPMLPPLPSSAEPWSILVQAGIIIPLCEGLLFWAYIQRAAEGLSRVRGAILAAILYAIYVTVLSRGVGLSAFPGLLFVGLAAAFATYFTGSAWIGTAVIAGFGAASPLLEDALFSFLGDQFIIQFGFRWLLIVAITAFLAFILLQVLRVLGSNQGQIDPHRERPKRYWWVPLLICIVLMVLVGSSEYALRNAQRVLREPVTPGSSAPPVAPPPQATPVPSQAP